MSLIKCKQCKTKQADIQTADDAFHKVVKCHFCGYTEDLRDYNKKITNKK